MRERKRILDQWLSRLEAEKGLIEGAILEINRRLAVVDEVEGWNLVTEPDDAADYPEADPMEFDPKESIEWVREPAYPLQQVEVMNLG